MSPRVRWQERRDVTGYWTTTDGRWKAADHKPSGMVTLTDTTRRARFATGQSWVRLPDWVSVAEVIRAHQQVSR